MQLRDVNRFRKPSAAFTTDKRTLEGIFDAKFSTKVTDRKWRQGVILDLFDIEINGPWKVLEKQGRASAVAKIGSTVFSGETHTYSKGMLRRPNPEPHAFFNMVAENGSETSVRNASLARMAILAVSAERNRDKFGLVKVTASATSWGDRAETSAAIPYLAPGIAGVEPAQTPGVRIIEDFKGYGHMDEPEPLLLAGEKVRIESAGSNLAQAVDGFEALLADPAYDLGETTMPDIFGMAPDDFRLSRQVISGGSGIAAARTILGLAS